LDLVILDCLAKHPEDRPQSAAELSGRLAAAVPDEPWTEERAHRWWDRHHPHSSWAQPADAATQILTKTIEAVRLPAETAARELDSARL
jgi:hypothetical protein